MEQKPLSNLVVKIAGERGRSSFLVMMVLVFVFAISVAGMAVVYILQRRKLAIAQGALRKKKEALRQAEENAQLEESREESVIAMAIRDELQQQVESQEAFVKGLQEKKTSFGEMVDGFQSWEDFRVEEPDEE